MDPTAFDLTKIGQDPLERVFPKFFIKTLKDEEASESAGQAVFKDVPYVEMHTPGDRRNIPIMRVTDDHKEYWHKQWEAFERGMEPEIDGFPLQEWPQMSSSMCMTLNEMHIFTVEQLAETQVDSLKNLGPGYPKLQELSVKFLERHDRKQEQITELQTENEDLKKRLLALEDAVSSKPKSEVPRPPAKKVQNAKVANKDSK